MDTRIIRHGRPGVQAEIRRLVVQMASDNPSWGYTRIQGALKNLGHSVARATVARILRREGIPPSRERPMRWRTFLRAHWSALLAVDFFTTEVWTVRGLVTYYTVFVIELHTRRVHVLGSTPYPDEEFVIQTMRELTDPTEGNCARLPSSSAIEIGSGASPFSDSSGLRCSSRADSVPCAELQCLCGAICPRDQGGMPEQSDPAR